MTIDLARVNTIVLLSGGVFPTGVFPTGVFPTGVLPIGVFPTAGGDSPTSRLRLHSVSFYSFINAVICFIEYAFTLLCRNARHAVGVA